MYVIFCLKTVLTTTPSPNSQYRPHHSANEGIPLLGQSWQIALGELSWWVICQSWLCNIEDNIFSIQDQPFSDDQT